MGSPLVPLVMYSWVPVIFYIYLRHPAQRAIIIGFIVATLFLPVVSFKFPGIPDYTKMTATSYGILLATAVYDSGRFSQFRFSWIDVPMLLWCVAAPVLSSLTNGLGAYDGFATALYITVTWGVPYFLGRLYLGNFEGMRQLAIGIFVGALVYVPFAWYEGRTYSSLHKLVYALDTGRDAAQSFRYGGYRPQVFMEHGLMLGAWFMTACLVGIMLWKTKTLKKMWGLSIGALMTILLLTFVAARSTGAYALFLFGAIILVMAWQFRTALLAWVMVGGICLYLYTSVMGTLPAHDILNFMGQIFSKDRVGSVEFRFNNEEVLGAKARQRMLFGWGGFGRNRVYDEYGEDTTVTDSLWIIAFGINGAFGLANMTGAILLPSVAFMVRYPAKTWKHPTIAPSSVIAVCLVLYMLDCLLNAMLNPIYILASGGLAGVAIQSKQSSEAQLNPKPARPVRRRILAPVPTSQS